MAAESCAPRFVVMNLKGATRATSATREARTAGSARFVSSTMPSGSAAGVPVGSSPWTSPPLTKAAEKIRQAGCGRVKRRDTSCRVFATGWRVEGTVPSSSRTI